MTYTRIFEGKFVSFVNSPRVLTAARQHFNCPTITGIPLESQGGTGSAGSHWEARYMLGDYMISTNYIDNVISDITLALFEDSGLYKVNYYSGGLFKFGKNMGCEFFNQNCIEGGSTSFPNDFCTVQNQPFCSRTKLMKGQCIITSQDDTIPKRYRYFSDSDVGGFEPANYCPVSNTVSQSSDYYHASCRVGSTSLSSDFGEVIGNSSFCFLSSLLPSNSQLSSSSRSICYQVECDSENKQIIVNIGNNKVYCPTNGGTIDNPSGFKGSINCPEYYEICGQETENEGEICNDMYDCFDKKAETNINTISFFPEEDYVYCDVCGERISADDAVFTESGRCYCCNCAQTYARPCARCGTTYDTVDLYPIILSYDKINRVKNFDADSLEDLMLERPDYTGCCSSCRRVIERFKKGDYIQNVYSWLTPERIAKDEFGVESMDDIHLLPSKDDVKYIRLDMKPGLKADFDNAYFKITGNLFSHEKITDTLKDFQDCIDLDKEEDYLVKTREEILEQISKENSNYPE